MTEDITELSGTDMLTGGYNRRGFIHNSENIFRHCADRTDYAVLYFNVRNFKAVNELFGIDTGDSVLRTIYKNMRSSSLKPVSYTHLSGRHGPQNFVRDGSGRRNLRRFLCNTIQSGLWTCKRNLVWSFSLGFCILQCGN